MSGVPFQRLAATSGDEAARLVNQQQQNTEDAIRQVFTQSPIADGVLLENLTLTNGNNPIAHKLGRKPRGWIIADQRNFTLLYRVSWDERTLTIFSSSLTPVVFSFWVF